MESQVSSKPVGAKDLNKATSTLVLIATGGAWPNAISYTSLRPDIGKVMIFATEKMLSAADALKNFIEATLGIGTVEIKDGAPTSNSFREFIKGIPENENLIVNMTGGLKLFWLCIPDLIKRKNTRIIYREISGWQNVTEQGENSDQVFLKDEHILDLQDSTDPDKFLHLTAQLQLTRPECKVSGTYVRKDKSQKAIEEFCSRAEYPEGTDFEVFMGAACAYLDWHTWHSVKVMQDKNVEHETDVFAIADDKALVFECKMDQGETSGIDVLTKLNTIASKLGGSQAKKYLLSPRWALEESHKQLANSLGIKVLGPEELSQNGIFGSMAESLKTEYTEDQKKLDEAFKKWIRNLSRTPVIFDFQGFDRSFEIRLPNKAGTIFFPGQDQVTEPTWLPLNKEGKKYFEQIEKAELRIKNGMPIGIIKSGKFCAVVPRQLAKDGADWVNRRPKGEPSPDALVTFEDLSAIKCNNSEAPVKYFEEHLMKKT